MLMPPLTYIHASDATRTTAGGGMLTGAGPFGLAPSGGNLKRRALGLAPSGGNLERRALDLAPTGGNLERPATRGATPAAATTAAEA